MIIIGEKINGTIPAVMDPINRDMMGTIFATEALLGRDKHSRKYSKAYRAGKIGALTK